MSYMYRLYNIKVVKLSVRELYMCCQTNGLWYPINPESDGQWLYNEVTRTFHTGAIPSFFSSYLTPFNRCIIIIQLGFVCDISKALEFITSMGDMGLKSCIYAWAI